MSSASNASQTDACADGGGTNTEKNYCVLCLVIDELCLGFGVLIFILLFPQMLVWLCWEYQWAAVYCLVIISWVEFESSAVDASPACLTVSSSASLYMWFAPLLKPIVSLFYLIY